MINYKKGVSEVLVSVLLILFVIVLIGIFTVVYNNLINKSSEDIDLEPGKNIISLDKEPVKKGNCVEIKVTKMTGSASIKKFRVLLNYNDGTKDFIDIESESEFKNVYETRIIPICNTIPNLQNINSLSVVPIILGNGGKDIIGIETNEKQINDKCLNNLCDPGEGCDCDCPCSPNSSVNALSPLIIKI